MSKMFREQEEQEKKNTRPGRGWLNPQNAKYGSFSHLAMLVFPSIYPQGIEDETLAKDKLNQLRNTIWRRVKDKSKKTGVSEKELQLAILDPDNQLGQEILKTISPLATITGFEGQDVRAWDTKMHTPTAQPAAVTSKQPSDKPKVLKTQFKKVQSLAGSSETWQENKKVISAFIAKVLKRAKEAGYLSKIRIGTGKVSGREVSPPEAVVISAARTVIDGISFVLADIAIRGILEYELIQVANKTEDDIDSDFGIVNNPEPFSQYTPKIYSKIVRQVELTGISLLGSTIDNLKKEWLKMADEALEKAGVDENLGEELDFFRRVLSKNTDEIYQVSPRIKQALEYTMESIQNTLYSGQLLREFTNILMDQNVLIDAFYDIDPELALSLKDKEDKDEPSAEKEDPFAKMKQSGMTTRPRRALRSTRRRDKRTIEFLGNESFSFKKYIS